jgi:hypothetical protein
MAPASIVKGDGPNAILCLRPALAFPVRHYLCS